jgi:hypothetical protein
MKICFNITFYLHESSIRFQITIIKYHGCKQNVTLRGFIFGIGCEYGSGTDYHLFAYNNTSFIIDVLLEFIAMTRSSNNFFVEASNYLPLSEHS